MLTFLCIGSLMSAQVTERERPASWDQLVEGGRFADRFLPMPDGKLSSDTWGGAASYPPLYRQWHRRSGPFLLGRQHIKRR